nr:MAG TPA_asm: hypothetical protein [Caudoviricetes sp.]
MQRFWPFPVLCFSFAHFVAFSVGCGQLACTDLLCTRMSRLVCLSSTSISWSVR